MPALAARFDAAMRHLGPFGPSPHLAVAVSGGADSTALALLTRDWLKTAGGTLVALIADHGLRPDSLKEAAQTAARMAAAGIASHIIPLDIPPGSALQERARTARHAALAAQAAGSGAVHLLFGHHAADQAEGLAMRAARGGGGGMQSLAARHDVVLLRPLLGIDPTDLRAELRHRGIGWIEDPSNQDHRFERIRVRAESPSVIPSPAPPDPAHLLAETCRIHPAGFALIRADRIAAPALSALIRTIGGASYPAPRAAIARLATALQSATLAGVQIMPAGRLGPGWLLLREPSACAPAIRAEPGAVWDQRFRIAAVPPATDTLGPLGRHAARFRRNSPWPAAILRGLPAFFRAGDLLAVPHCQADPYHRVFFTPPMPATASSCPP